MVNVAIFASGSGTNFEEILKHVEDGSLPVHVSCLIVDKEKAFARQRARNHFIPEFYFDPKAYKNKAEYERAILEVLNDLNVDLIVLSGYMRFIGPVLLEAYPNKIMNLHPAYLPEFPGAHSIQDAYMAKVSQTGVTVHFVDEGVDSGPIIEQRRLKIDPSWDLETLESHVHALEYELFWQVIKKVAESMEGKRMKRALVSVSNKENLVPFVSGLINLGYEIISTGGTKRALEDAGLSVIGISEITNFPEIMDGRVKTLHPNVHGALLCVRDNPDHCKQIEELGIDFIDLVCVNLYPFKETVQKEGVSHAEIIENIDIGGPSMLRSASKNYQSIPVLCDPKDYDLVLDELRDFGETRLETRERLAAKVFRHTARYDAMIADYLTKKVGEQFPESLTITFDKVQDLRYGENPHQKAAFYKGMNPKYSLANAKQLHGKELSYNNIQDGNAAIEILKDFEGQFAAVGLKHMNPCGVGIGESINAAWDKAYEADPVSIFGGIVALNAPVDVELAEKLSKIFLEIVIAPKFEQEALDILTKKKNIRLMELDTTLNANTALKYTNVNDGLLVQDMDTHSLKEEDLRCVTNRKPTQEEMKQLLFGWNVVKHVKSNAIVLVKDNMTIGVGAGQMNRVGAAKIAIEQAGDKAKGSVMASDAFFPMPDTVEEAVKAGVTAIIQPGGSIKDQLSIDVCNENGIAMVFTGVRHFKH